MDAQVFAIWFMLPLVLVVEVGVARQFLVFRGPVHAHTITTFAGASKRTHVGSLALAAAWLVLTLVLWLYEFVVGQVFLYLLLFMFGRPAAAAGLVALAAVALYTPVAAAQLLRRAAHARRTAQHAAQHS